MKVPRAASGLALSLMWVAISACASAHGSDSTAALTSGRLDEHKASSTTGTARSSRVQHELFFGLATPDGSEVSEAEWTDFLEREVTPRFGNGLTVLDGAGQYRSRGGPLIRERTKILVLIYPDTPEVEHAIETIIDVYRRRFAQESVGWVKTPVEAVF